MNMADFEIQGGHQQYRIRGNHPDSSEFLKFPVIFP
jgi:hypothetical protein